MSAIGDALRRLGERMPGARAVCLVGTDGIPVESWVRPHEELSIEAVAAEIARLLKAATGAGNAVGPGQVREVATVSDRAVTVVSRVTAEYYLLLLLGRDGSLGRGRFELARTAGTLEKELV